MYNKTVTKKKTKKTMHKVEGFAEFVLCSEREGGVGLGVWVNIGPSQQESPLQFDR